MKDLKLELERAYRFCKLLKIDCIKSEIESHLNGYVIDSIERKNGEWNCSLTDKKNNYITLTISFNKISILKCTDDSAERIAVEEDLLLSHRIVEKRPKGIIYSIIQKQFGASRRFQNEVVLVDLIEQRNVFVKDNIECLLGNIDFQNDRLSKCLLKLRMLEHKTNLKEQADYSSEFSTHMNYYVNWEGGRQITDNIYPTRTYLNGEEISKIYDVDNGPDKLYRIFDLYSGIINGRDEKDLNLINLGFLSKDAYDLKGLKGITEHENFLVGKSQKSVSDEYINYLKKMLNEKFGYTGDLQLERDSILCGITYYMTGPELAKRQIEKKLGISYNEFEQLDLDEQHKLIEQITGKKLKPDYRFHIDGIPIDENHIMTMEQVDERIDELTESGPKRFLKRLLKTFDKK